LLTPKHIARADREQTLRNRILAGAGLILLLVIGLLTYGWIQVNVIQPPQPVAIVNGQEISTGTFRDRVKLVQYNLQSQYSSLTGILAVVGDDAQARSTYQSQLNNVAQQLGNPLFVGSSVLDGLIQEVLVEQEAKRRGILVTAQDLDQAIEENFGFSEQPAVVASESASIPSPTASDLNPTPSAPGPTPSPLSTTPGAAVATPYTRDLFERNYQAFLTNLGSFGVNDSAVRSELQAQLYRQRLGQTFEPEVPRVQEQVWARHILVAEETLAADLLEQARSGADWEALAAEHTTDEAGKANGGDLGWFARGRMVEPFEAAAFAGQVGDIVGPVQSDFGWHIIEILGHEDRELSDSDFQSAVALAFDEWLSKSRDAAEITIRDYWIERVPSAPILPASQG
jgi:parvulin-like peptidyl-prolyl isomerase